MKKIVIAVVVGLVAAVGWFLFSPLVIETRVDESFPIGNAQPGADRIARVSAMESASAPMPTM